MRLGGTISATGGADTTVTGTGRVGILAGTVAGTRGLVRGMKISDWESGFRHERKLLT